jgi:hypothetical protein
MDEVGNAIVAAASVEVRQRVRAGHRLGDGQQQGQPNEPASGDATELHGRNPKLGPLLSPEVTLS